MAPARLRMRSDEQLLALFRAGREDAFEVIHHRHRRRLHAMAARTLRGHGGDPEGVVQEAFVRAHRALRADDRSIPLGPWLHRVVRNLCLDELRRARPRADLRESDAAVEDVFVTLSRRDQLRRLVEDLADLSEMQRAALLLRELDGLTHEQVAEVLEISPAASRQLVTRARSGLVAFAEARDADCEAIRADLLTAHDERRRPSERSLRHVRHCAACREYRAALKASRARLRALVPPLGFGPLAGVLRLLGGGGGSGVGVKLAVVGAAVAGSAGLIVAGSTQVIHGGGPAPHAEGGGRALIGTPIRRGTPLPRRLAIVTVAVRLLPTDRRNQVVRVTCPAGMGAAGLTQPRAADGRVRSGTLAMYQYSDRDVAALRRGGRRNAAIRYRVASGLAKPGVVRIGTLCKRRG